MTALLIASIVLGLWLLIAIRSNSPVDFYVYYMAGSLARHGHNFYAVSQSVWDYTARSLGIAHFTWPYRYPPYTAALAGTLTHLGPHWAMVAWVVANAVALLGGAVLLGLALRDRWGVPLALAALVCFGPVYHTLYDGQVNGLVFLALAIAFWGLARGRDLPAGAGVAVAAALKLTPIALIGYLAWRRRWRALVVAIAALGVLTVATFPITGFTLYAQYADRAYALTDPQHVNPSGANQSGTGAFARLLLPSSSKATSGEVPEKVRLLATAFTAVLIGSTAVVAWPRRRRRTQAEPTSDDHSPTRDDHSPMLGDTRGRGPASFEELLGFGMVIAATLVIGPFTWYHQFTWLLILLVTIADRLLMRRRWWLLAFLGLLVVGVDANEIFWTVLRHFAISSGLYRALSLPFATAVITWAVATVMILVDRRRRGLDGGTRRPA